IGSLFAMDVKPRQPINSACRRFMGVMADNVIRHLESQRERVERERAFNMNMCLAAFVDPGHQIWRRRKKPGSRPRSIAKSSPPDRSPVKPYSDAHPKSSSKPPSPTALNDLPRVP